NDWKITSDNSRRWFQSIILDYFMRNYTSDLFSHVQVQSRGVITEIVNLLFPSVNSVLFKSFLSLVCSTKDSVKGAIELYPTFDIKLSLFSLPIQNEQDRERALIEDEEKRKKETINIIFDLFDGYGPMARISEDYREEDLAKLSEISTDKRKQIIAHARKSKFQKILNELRSQAIQDFCQKDEVYEERRKDLIYLLELLIKEASERATSSK
ncbi:MAG: hypothetical protein OXF52_06400, partial [Candidatus Dadabacteria bacterium]|nr:hypothetical protein [Candidatus Dadabacteria bacterium]